MKFQDALIKRGSSADEVQRSVRGGLITEWDEIATKAADEVTDEERTILAYIISDDTVDRHGDTASMDGWELQHYKNVVLWSHKADIAPIAKALRTYRYGELRSVAAFTTDEENAFGASIGRLAKAGFIPQASVGFLGVEGKMAEDEERLERYWYPIDYTKQELMEWSPVNIGSNRNAVVLGLQQEANKETDGTIMRLVDWALQQSNVPEELVEFCKDFYDSGVIYSVPSQDTEEKNSGSAIESAPQPIERQQPVDLGKIAQEIFNV
jgi:hypothetical protein